MADKLVRLKRKTATGTDVLFPETKVSQVIDLTIGGKIDHNLLPDSVFDTLKYGGSYGESGVGTAPAEKDIILPLLVALVDKGLHQAGAYVLFTKRTKLLITGNSTQVEGKYYKGELIVGDTDGANENIVEPGDWIVIDEITGTGTSGSPYVVKAAIINNTYEKASASAPGIVTLLSDTIVDLEELTGFGDEDVITTTSLGNLIARSNVQRVNADDVLSEPYLLTGYHTHNDLQAKTTKLTNLLALSTTGFVRKGSGDTWTVDTATYLTSIPAATSGALGGIKIGFTTDAPARKYAVQLDSEKAYVNVPWTDTNTWVANSKDVAGYVSAPTSSNANKVWKTDGSGQPGWRDDANTLYTLPLAANGTRGGIQLGFANTETSRAVAVSSEKAYISLPRQIPKLNNSDSGGTFYAPTAAGTAGDKLISKAGVPSWISAGLVFSNSSDFNTHGVVGDILIEEV